MRQIYVPIANYTYSHHKKRYTKKMKWNEKMWFCVCCMLALFWLLHLTLWLNRTNCKIVRTPLYHHRN